MGAIVFPLRKPWVFASNAVPPDNLFYPLTPTGSPEHEQDNLNQEPYCQGIAAEVFKFQVPSLEWVISNSISGEFLWVLPSLAEGEMTQTVEYAVPNRSSMRGLWKLLGMVLTVPKGSTQRRARGWNILSAKLIADFLD